MQGERFDQITRSVSTALMPLGGPDSFPNPLKVLAMLIVAFLKRIGLYEEEEEDGFVWKAGTPADLVTLERMQYVRTRKASDIRKVKINPRQFLASIQQDSRTEFLSVITPAQQQQFLRVKTSREFFNILTPDQRALLAVKYQPEFRTAATLPRYHPGPGVVVPAAPYPAIAYTPRAPTRLNPTAWLPQPPVVLSSANACNQAGLTWKSCYYTYQATLETDRDGAPCTYGPYPCGSGFPPIPPGKTYESPFCPYENADNYGCGALANQVQDVTNCPKRKDKYGNPIKGVPLEHICNATNNVNCSYADVSQAKFTSVVTDRMYNKELPKQPNPCIIDSYRDPVSGDLIQVPIKTDSQGASPCIQQSDPGACGGIDCPCPGLYISQSAYRSPTWNTAAMNPDNYLNALFIPFISVTNPVYINCGLQTGMFVVASTSYDPQNNPTEDPNDWVAGILADTGGHKLGEVSYAMRYRLGLGPKDNPKVTFRIYPQLKVGWPVTLDTLDALKNKYLGVCCPGKIDDQCHAAEKRGICVTDTADPNAGSCHCMGGWLPDIHGDCTWLCPGSDDSRWVGTSTDSGYEECDGNGKCAYQVPNENGDTIGVCECDDGWWSLLSKSCLDRDCVKAEDRGNTSIPPCYGHGQCHRGVNTPGTCTCDDGWTNGHDGLQYCSEQACDKNCSGHGTCLHLPFSKIPICTCDVDHGWYGSDCSQRGCVTQDGRICSGNGTCQLDAHGNPCCSCPDEWGGGCQTGPTACSQRKCPGCPPGVATCTNDWNWTEIFCLCICGNNCNHKWTCHCNDSSLKPPGCTTKKCCHDFWGECNIGMHGQGIGGGGICQANGVCQCYDNFDPNRCCGYPLPGSYPPPGFGYPCIGASARTINLSCSGDIGACGSCRPGSTTGSWTLHPDGGGKFHDDLGNTYRLDEHACKVSITAFGPGTYGGQCGKAPDPMFWLSIAGNTGTGRSGTICPTDCSDCHTVIPCSLTLS